MKILYNRAILSLWNQDFQFWFFPYFSMRFYRMHDGWNHIDICFLFLTIKMYGWLTFK